MTIGHRTSVYDEYYIEEPIKVGMVIAGKVDEDGKYLDMGLGYFGDFAYIIQELTDRGINTRDLGHNNFWFISKEDLHKYELVDEHHPNNEDVDASYINRTLAGWG